MMMKNCGYQRNCIKRLEEVINKKRFKKTICLVKKISKQKYTNKHNNNLTISKETNLFKIGGGDKVSKKLRQSKSPVHGN